MCGITGIINRNGMAVAPDVLKRMADTMAHRGPDEDGFYIKGPIGFAMKRLSIIDLRPGNIPVHNENRTIWVAQNGEIYNFRGLRSELERDGHRFYTETDTEVIVHAYEKYGDLFLDHLKGMFAIALWDEKRKRLLLARDRMGQKPLCYYVDDNVFLFASEMKSILEHPGVNREMDLEALGLYLEHQ